MLGEEEKRSLDVCAAMLAAQVFYVISIIYIFIGDTLGILRMLSRKNSDG